jgi:putative sterol carrier protein
VRGVVAEGAREFFQGVDRRLDRAKTAGHTVSYRFDIDGAGSWRVAVDDGAVAVEESDADADCVIQASENDFMKLVRGEGNPTTMFMTGKLKVKGDIALALRLRELFF